MQQTVCKPSIFNPLTPELPQRGVHRPGAHRHNIICNSFFPEISKPLFRLYGAKSKTRGQYFGLMGICNGRFFGLTG